MLKKKEVILAKLEVTYNTDPVPVAATDAVLVESFEPALEGLKILDRPAPKNTLGSYAPVYAGSLRGLTIVVRYRGSGAAGTAPEISPLLQACGLGETITPATSVAYSPISSSFKSCTIYRYKDGRLHKYTGCVGNLQVNQTVGGFHMFTFNMVGHYGTTTDTALASPTYDSTVPAPVLGGNFTIGAYGAIINALQFDLGNALALAPDYNSADGYGEIRITDRKVTGSIDPEDVLIATNDFEGDFTGGTSMAIASGTLGPAAGNRIAIAMPAVKYTNYEENDRDGISTLNLPFAAEESSGDDEVTITFT